MRYKKVPEVIYRKVQLLDGECEPIGRKIEGAKDIYRYYKDIQNSAVEKFIAVYLDSRNRILASNIIEVGTVNQANPLIREIFRFALLNNAVALIVIHNHPSGDPIPSKEDKVFSGKTKEASEVLSIKYLDSVIIADRYYFSFAEQGLI